MANDKQPWERQPGETDTAFAAFCRYRDMPLSARSARLAALAETKGTQSANIRKFQAWSAKYSWVERVAAYSDHLDTIARQERERAIREMEQRQARTAQAIHHVVNTRLQQWMGTQEALAETARSLTPYQLARLIDTAARLERQALGYVPEPPPKKPDFTALLEELAEVKAMAREARDWNLYFQVLREERAIQGTGAPVVVKVHQGSGDWRGELQSEGLDPDEVFNRAVEVVIAEVSQAKASMAVCG